MWVNFFRLVRALGRQRWLLLLSYRAGLLLSAIGIVAELLMFRFLGRWIDGMPAGQSIEGGYFGFVAIGSAALNLASGLASAVPSRLREGQLTGEAEVLFLAPVRDVQIVLALALSCLPQALLRFGFELLVAQAMGAAWHWHLWVFALATLGLVLGALPFALIGCAFVLLFKRGEPVAWGLSVSALLVSGVWFPRASVPASLQLLGSCFFTTHAIELLRVAVSPAVADVGKPATLLAIVIGISWIAALGTLALALKLGKSRGDFSRY